MATLFQSDTKGINAKICKAFEKFGKIESVDDVNSSTAKAKTNVHEVYVTFERSEDAYNAFIENRNDTKSSDEIITVLPIDTWKIAPNISKDDEVCTLSRRITEVDEDGSPQYIYRMFITRGMLLRVFEAFLRVSKEFLNGLDLYYELDEEYDNSSGDESDESEVTVCTQKTEETEAEPEYESDNDECVDGSGDDSVQSDESDEEPEKDCLKNHEFEKRVAEVIVDNLGAKFESLTIRKDEIAVELLQWFAPALKQVQKLAIHTESNCSILYALPSYCPSATSFHLDGVNWTGDFEDFTAQAWPSLQELYLDVSNDTDENKQKFRTFIELNPQLISMQIDSAIDLDTLAVIGQKTVGLNNLAIKRSSFEGLNCMLDNLAGLTELNGLKITALNVEKDHLNGLVKCAKRLSRLQNLELITIFINCQSAGNEDFKHLSEFCITHHNNCKCHGPNRVISLRNRDIEIPEESSVLVLIVNTKPPSNSADSTLEADILATFKKANKFFPNIIEHVELAEKDNHVYIQISSDR